MDRQGNRQVLGAARARHTHPARWLLPALLIVAWLGVGGVLGPLGGKLAEVTENGNAAYLPRNAEASVANELIKQFGEGETLPAVVVYQRDGGLADADRSAVRQDIDQIQADIGSAGVLSGPPIGPVESADGEAVQVIVPFAGSDISKVESWVERLREIVHGGQLTAHVTGPAGLQADMRGALGAIDLMLVLVTSAVILLILFMVYRSVLLPLLVLSVAGTALMGAMGILYILAKQDILSLGSEAQGILQVLVLGAATDYALLLIARYRDELDAGAARFPAMVVALRRSVEPIAASAATVVLGLLCLLISDLGLNRALGPAGAIGIACAALAMTTFLPAVLVLFGRIAFWPRRLGRGGAQRAGARGVWASVAALVDRRPRLLWIGTAIVLALLSLGVLRLNADGIPDSKQLIHNDVDSRFGTEALAEHFTPGAGNPAIVITQADAVDDVAKVARSVPGVISVQPFTGGPPGQPGTAEPAVVNGLARVDVTLDSAPDSDAAARTLRALRNATHGVPGAQATVGGYTAVKVDFNDAAKRDRVAMPLLLIMVFIVIAVLLRSLVAPLLLLGTVVLSFLAAIGVSTLVFQQMLGFAGVDSTFPLHAFVFLVALGVDYNIFLMTRVREETQLHGTRQGMLNGLRVTGGVITSAGVVLAATFAALAMIPLVLLVELAFTVAFGVLLDAVIVRSILVPALVVDTGRWVWWPSRLSRAERSGTPDSPLEPPAAVKDVEAVPVGGQ